MNCALRFFIVAVAGILIISPESATATEQRKCTSPKISCGPRNNDRQCLICNCFFESRGEPEEGQKLVTRAVIARTKSDADNWPNSVCGVVYQASQFSWTADKNSNAFCPSFPEAQVCMKTTDQVLRNPQASSAPLWFHTPNVKPVWRKKLKLCKVGSGGRVGNHVFYCAKAKPQTSSKAAPSRARR